MTDNPKPHLRPFDPRFSCGPTRKFPGWSADQLSSALVGRSHRAACAKQRLVEAFDRTLALLECPPDYKAALVAGSDTGAMEAAIWSLLGPRGVDVFAWDAFGARWARDARDELKLEDLRIFEETGGKTPDFSQADPARDTIFTWNATAAGARVPNGDFIASDREGLTIVDATSAAFAMEMDWDKIDVLTFSWQKSMGGEAQHGLIIMGPRAIERLNTFRPENRPIPRLFQLHGPDGANMEIYEGRTLNTFSLLCVEDYLLALKWAAKIGGLPALTRRVVDNYEALAAWVEKTEWIDFLCEAGPTRSPASVTLKFADPDVVALPKDAQWKITHAMVSLLDREGAAVDCLPHPSGEPGIRVWCGPTVETDDVAALGPWLDWAYREVQAGA